MLHFCLFIVLTKATILNNMKLGKACKIEIKLSENKCISKKVMDIFPINNKNL